MSGDMNPRSKECSAENGELTPHGGEPSSRYSERFTENADLFALSSDPYAEDDDSSAESSGYPIQSADPSPRPQSGHGAIFSAYAVASQVGFLVIVPLLVFIWGGSWLVDRFSLPGWTMVLFVFLGIFVMICSVVSYLYRMIKMYGGDQKFNKSTKLKHDVRDHDYYSD